MNEFIEQFLIEARELVEQATGDLLALEDHPGDKERLDSAFRAFHTLKGAAAIVDFTAMERALHAAEEALSRVREAGERVAPLLIGDLLSALDQVLQWLEIIRTTNELPPHAETLADVIVASFSGAAIGSTETATIAASWLEGLLAAFPDAAGEARTALVYRPDASAFFRGEDPLATVEQLPGLLGVRLTPVAGWRPLDTFDPFACSVVLTALTREAPARIAHQLAAISAQIEIVELPRPGADLPAAGHPLADRSSLDRKLFEAQIRMLEAANDEGLTGRLASAARVAVHVLVGAGLGASVDDIERALSQSIEAKARGPLVAALQAVLSTGGLAVEGRPAAAISAFQEPAARALRVDVERVDALVRLTGELTVVKNAIGHVTGLAEAGVDATRLGAALRDHHATLDRLVSDLQHAVLGIRVLPLRHVFRRFPRLVRELGAALGKPVRLLTEGDDTEADKAVVENLFEPLLHVVRNALDHGLEGGGRRSAAGKPGTGTIRMRAARAGEHVVVEVEDDGGGVDVDRVRAVAAARGIVTPEQLTGMAEAEIVDLIFSPGFSTATNVTGVSGRGVGMDAVRAAVARMGGRVAIESRGGHGTSVRFVLPFTVMMTRVMTVEIGGQAFGVPLASVVETVRLPRGAVRAIGGAQAFVLRDRTVALVHLGAVLGAQNVAAETSEANVVVACVGGQWVGLQVERIGSRMDIMLKPADGLLSGIAGVSGVTLLGDGGVLIVLDLQDLLA